MLIPLGYVVAINQQGINAPPHNTISPNAAVRYLGHVSHIQNISENNEMDHGVQDAISWLPESLRGDGLSCMKRIVKQY